MMGDQLKIFDGRWIKKAAEDVKDTCFTKACKVRRAAKAGDKEAVKAVIASMTTEEKEDAIKESVASNHNTNMDLITDMLNKRGNLADNFLRCDSAGNCMMDDRLSSKHYLGKY